MISLDGAQIALFKKFPCKIEEIQVSRTNYKRPEMTCMDWLVLEDDGLIVNYCDVDFIRADSQWGKVTHFGIYDKDNNLLFIEPLDRQILVDKDIQVRFSRYSLKISIAALKQKSDMMEALDNMEFGNQFGVQYYEPDDNDFISEEDEF